MARSRRLLRIAIVAQLLFIAALLGRSGASADAYPTITPGDIEAHIAEIQGKRSGLGDEAQRAKLSEAAGYIRGEMEGSGLSVVEDPVTFSGQTFPNVVGTMTGTTCPEKTFIVSAHYDGVAASPAADDDASGVAAVLELARAFSGQPFQASIDFVAFSFEEQGMIGSGQMAAAASEEGREILGMINFDMIAYRCDEPGCQDFPEGIPPPRPAGDFIAVIGNTASHSLLESFTAASASAVPDLVTFPLEVTGNGETLPDVRRADHAPFWDRGYQALFLTDTAEFRNPNYHQARDTLDTLDLAFAADVANASMATVVAVLTADANGDGRADVCGPAPVGGTAESPQPTTMPQQAQPTAAPESVAEDSSGSNLLLIGVIVGAAVVALGLASVLYLARRRAR